MQKRNNFLTYINFFAPKISQTTKAYLKSTLIYVSQGSPVFSLSNLLGFYYFIVHKLLIGIPFKNWKTWFAIAFIYCKGRKAQVECLFQYVRDFTMRSLLHWTKSSSIFWSDFLLSLLPKRPSFFSHNELII